MRITYDLYSTSERPEGQCKLISKVIDLTPDIVFATGLVSYGLYTLARDNCLQFSEKLEEKIPPLATLANFAQVYTPYLPLFCH